MSSAVESKSRPSAPSWQPEVLLVGNAMIAAHLTQMVQLAGSKMQIKLDPLVQKDVRPVCFGRDSRIMLLDGSYLVPYCIALPDWQLEIIFKAMLPLTSAHFLKNADAGYGKGFIPECAGQALQFAKENDIPCTVGKSVIEGGNCHLFSTSEGTPKAIIGDHSLLLTVIGLGEQGDFESPRMREIQELLQSRLSAPSQESLRMARNLHLLIKYAPIFSKIMENQKRIDEWLELPIYDRADDCEDYFNLILENGQLCGMLTSVNETDKDIYDLFLEPLSAEDSSNPQFLKEAWEWEARISFARELIAEELRVDQKNAIFIPQVDFHIDMDIFVEPETQTVIMHDEGLSLEFLRRYPFCGRRSFLAAAEERLKMYGPTYAAMESKLNEGGCRVVKVAGCFETRSSRVNFMNGCFIPAKGRMTFVTNGSSTVEILENFFSDQMWKLQPNVEVSFLNSSMINQILTRASGGLHCLTWPMGNPSLKGRVSLKQSRDS